MYLLPEPGLIANIKGCHAKHHSWFESTLYVVFCKQNLKLLFTDIKDEIGDKYLSHKKVCEYFLILQPMNNFQIHLPIQHKLHKGLTLRLEIAGNF